MHRRRPVRSVPPDERRTGGGNGRHQRTDRNGHHRRRTSRARGRVPPPGAQAPLPDPRRGPTRRYQLAGAVGLTRPVHTRPLFRLAGFAIPPARRLVPDEGRGRGLPRGVRPAVRTADPSRGPRRPGIRPWRRLRRARRQPPDRSQERDRGDGSQPRASHAGAGGPARPRDRPTPLQRVPPAIAAPGRWRADRRGGQLRGRHRDGTRARASHVALARTPGTCPFGSKRPSPDTWSSGSSDSWGSTF